MSNTVIVTDPPIGVKIETLSDGEMFKFTGGDQVYMKSTFAGDNFKGFIPYVSLETGKQYLSSLGYRVIVLSTVTVTAVPSKTPNPRLSDISI